MPKYLFGCSTNKTNGCLLNPEGGRMILSEEYKNYLKPNLKIHTHVFYKSPCRTWRVQILRKIKHRFSMGKVVRTSQKRSEKSITITDMVSPLKKYSKINYLNAYSTLLLHICST